MAYCTLCALFNFIFFCVKGMLTLISDHPLVLFIFSTVIATVIIANIHYGTQLAFRGSPRNIRKANAGPHTWDAPPNNQSPINIIPEQTRRLDLQEKLTWHHYEDLPIGIKIHNNGNTVILRAAFSGNIPTIGGADLLASYCFVEIRFRWCLLNSEGSEHMINFKKFPMEIQVMHRTGPPEGTSSYDLLIVSYLYDITTSHNPYLEPVVQNLHCICEPGSSVEIPPFPLSYLCCQFRSNFYSYGGSLTEPPCYEGVEWFIYPEPLAISERQINQFRQLLSNDGVSRIVRNARPIQPLTECRVVNFNCCNTGPAKECQPITKDSIESIQNTVAQVEEDDSNE
ncbi:putative carbonic anhydrase 3 isoform X2 [Teleopsis dalmanni]|uniref:putative carbonic anhydrase 3 isoform X2 n=1 Tax=Teleopsis dalmanni TaxID=139649 RepID=UPI0018CD8CB5|nr:putative carbonic anhydrase 3 isoform X2 [Teleopsis dalmanni]